MSLLSNEINTSEWLQSQLRALNSTPGLVLSEDASGHLSDPNVAPAPPTTTKMPIPPARLLSRRCHNLPGKLRVCELFFEVPLIYTRSDATGPSDSRKLRLFARSVHRLESSAINIKHEPRHLPYLVYIPGGPGFGAHQPQDYAITNALLDKGYQVLYFDHRGMGMSTPVTARTLREAVGDDAKAQAEYLKCFRADSAVRDLEAVRTCLTEGWPAERRKWSLMGQSYGGFVSVCCLSWFPDGLREVFTMGGLPPLELQVRGQGPDEVYRRLVKKMKERNGVYYGKFPEDVEAVRKVIGFLQKEGGVGLPNGGRLTAERFMGLGLAFGAHGGLDNVHDVVLRCFSELEGFGFLTRPTLGRVESLGAFDNAVLYALLHEACYSSGVATRWSAERVMGQEEDFDVKKSDGPVLFAGEVVLKHNFKSYTELEELAPAAEVLAQTEDWPELYDVEQLKRNEVPVYSSTYVDDMYVDFGFAHETAALIKGCKTFVTNAMYHNAPSAKGDEVMRALFALKEDSLD